MNALVQHEPMYPNSLRQRLETGLHGVRRQARMRHQVAPYRWLAEYYDEVFMPRQSPLAAARRKLLKKILPTVESACDLACGTGETALEFARRGIDTIAVDLSPTMCRLASEKALRERLPVQVIQADMRTFHLERQVDLVSCECDALNHVRRRSDLAKVARAVHRALRAGGYFLFDVNNARGFRRYWTGNVWVEKPGVVLSMRNGHSRNAQRAWSDVDWFICSGEQWKRHHERVEEVCWSRGEIEQTLRDAGFSSVRAWDAAPFFHANRLVTRGCHTIYLARNSA